MAEADIEPKTLTRQLLQLRCRDEISPEEEAALANASSGSFQAAARQRLVTAKQPLYQSNLLVEGIVARSMLLSDGSRQIVALHVPGDFVDLHSFLLSSIEHDLEALTPITMAVFPHEQLRQLTQTHPHLSRLLWLMTLVDAAVHREWILNIGRRQAKKRLAHLFCELRTRLAIVGLADDAGYALPITQGDLGDASGLTTVHVNRVLRELRDDGLVDFRSGWVRIGDLRRLETLAEFDPFYLEVRRVRR